MPELLDKRLVFVTGKGGVGKSTVSIALGLAAAARGKRTIVCEVSSQENASRVFKKGEVGFNEVEVADNLWAISIDPDESLREYLLLQLKVRAMRDLLVRSRIFNYLAAATPGLKELVTIGKIWELAQPDRKVKKAQRVRPGDRRRARDRARHRLPADPAHLRRHRAGGPDPLPGRGARRFITDHDTTGVAIVSLPEEMPVNESAVARASLTEEVGVAVDRVYMNAHVPGALREGRGRELERALRTPRGPPGPRSARRSPSTAARAPSATSSSGCKTGRALAGQDPALHLQAAPRRAGAAAARRGGLA